MKKCLFIILLLVAGIYGGAQFNAYRHIDDPIVASHVPAPEEKTSHLLTLKERGDFGGFSKYGYCTGTVIAPHAILTAEHCTENGSLAALEMDYGLETYHVKQILKDHNEHVILLLDGPAFVNIQEYKTRAPKTGEHEFFYGCGGVVYPPHKTSGVVVNEFDPSEVNANGGLAYYSSISIPGDSGSAVYGDDGSILTLVTFHLTEHYLLTDKSVMGGYALKFTPAQIKKAKEYVDIRIIDRAAVQAGRKSAS